MILRPSAVVTGETAAGVSARSGQLLSASRAVLRARRTATPPIRGYEKYAGHDDSRNAMPSAVSSAIFDATGVRLRTMPFTAEVVKAAVG